MAKPETKSMARSETKVKSTDEGVVAVNKSIMGTSRIRTMIAAIVVVLASILVAVVLRDPGQFSQFLPSDIVIQDIKTSTSSVSEFIKQLQKVALSADSPSDDSTAASTSTSVNNAAVDSSVKEEVAAEPKPERASTAPKSAQSSIIKWMLEGGASFPHLQLVEYDNEYRGIHATGDLAEDEVLISVPEKFIITFSTALNSDIGQRLTKALPEYNDMDMSHYLISIFMVVEYDKGAESWWWPYLQTLPTQFENMPVHFTPEEKQLMKESRLGSLLDDSFQSDYDEICGVLPDFCQNHTLERYIWGRLILRTRAFSLDKDGIEQTALQPFADMVNHDFENVASWRYNQETHVGEIYTKRSVKAGEIVTISYGAKSNRILLSTYGFVVKDNPYHETPIYLQLPDGEIQSGMLARRVAKTGNPNTQFYRIRHTITLSTSDNDFKKIMKLCRVAIATSEELDQYHDFNEPVNLRNEAAALQYLQEYIDDALYKYSSTVDDDEELLRNSSLTTNTRNIIITRQSDKFALLKMIELIEDLMDIVPESVDFASFNKRRYHKKYAEHKTYIRNLLNLRRSKRQIQ